MPTKSLAARELALVQALDAARDASHGTADLLHRVATTLCAAVDAEECCVGSEKLPKRQVGDMLAGPGG